MKTRAVFLDRDGVLAEVIDRGGRPGGARSFDEFKLIPGSREAIARLKKAGFLAIVVTNQPDIARGLLSRQDLERMNDLLRRELKVDDILTCPHDNVDDCSCRKPRPGLLLQAAEKWGIDLARSVIVGDRESDVKAGRAAGCVTVLIDAPYNRGVKADHHAADLPAAATIIIGKG